MTDQLGLFAVDATPTVIEAPAGTWEHEPGYTDAEYARLFEWAAATLATLPDTIGRRLLHHCLGCARVVQVDMQQRVRSVTSGSYRLWRTTFTPSGEDAGAFIAACAAVPGVVQGIESKVREGDLCFSAGMHVPGAGSVVLRVWEPDNYAVDFSFGRDPFFLDSFRDSVVDRYAPYASWGHCYAGQRIAEAREAAPSLPSFMVDGREYVTTGGHSQGARRVANAWTFRPAADWNGPTYTYATLRAAWDAGRLERGDERGLLVTIRGVPCVFDGYARFYDDKVDISAALVLRDDDEEDVDGCTTADCEDEELEAA